MLRRVRNKNDPNYDGRGITVCDRWRLGEDGKLGFECFLEDLGPCPSPEHTIDRWPNKHGNYEPGNCRWATKKEQANNRRSNVILAFDSDTLTETLTLAQWGCKLGWQDSRLRQRLRKILQRPPSTRNWQSLMDALEGAGK
jgi:hypothetical protein